MIMNQVIYSKLQNGFKAFRDLKRRFSSPLKSQEKSSLLSQFGEGLATT